jgi:ankyrin repeat protein
MLAAPASPASALSPSCPSRMPSVRRGNPVPRLRTMASFVDDPGKAQRRARQFGQLLHLAVEKRNGPAVLELLEQRVDPAVRLPGSVVSPLHRALRLGDEYIATLLAAAGADIEEPDETGATALIRGVRNGFSDKFVALLCEMGANVDATDNLGSSCLHIAAASSRGDDCIGVLIEAGADTNAVDGQGLTPLATAVVKRKPCAVARLVEHGADLGGRVGGGVAAVGGGGGSSLGSTGRTVLHIAIANQDLEMVRLLGELGAYLDSGFGDHTALTYAISIQAFDTAELLIESGADVNRQTRSGNFPLLAAVAAGSETLTRSLLRRSASVWMASSSGCYPVHMAARKNRPDLVRLLVKRGSQVDLVSNHGDTPLCIAVRLGNQACIECLISLGADVNHMSRNPSSKSLLWLALGDGSVKVAETLIKAGADAGVGVVDDKGCEMTPLHFACARGLTDLVRFMLDAGANAESQVWPGHSPLFTACGAGHLATARLLVDQGAANIHAESAAGATALFGCTAHVAMVKHLVARGINVSHRDHNGATALHYAGLHGHHAAAKVLLQHGAKSLHANAVYDSLEDYRLGVRYRQGTPAGVARQRGYFKVAKLIDGWKYKS